MPATIHERASPIICDARFFVLYYFVILQVDIYNDRIMNDRDIFDFINDNFTMRANVNCYNKLNCFVDAMRNNQYYPITDEEIHRGVEYKKTEGKALLKLIDPIILEKDKHLAETIVETFCEQSLQQFLEYKRSYEKNLRQPLSVK